MHLGDLVDEAANSTTLGVDETYAAALTALKGAATPVRTGSGAPQMRCARHGRAAGRGVRSLQRVSRPFESARQLPSSTTAVRSRFQTRARPPPLPARPPGRPQLYLAVGDMCVITQTYQEIVHRYELESRDLLPRHARAAYYTFSPAKGQRVVVLDFYDSSVHGRPAGDHAQARGSHAREPSDSPATEHTPIRW